MRLKLALGVTRQWLGIGRAPSRGVRGGGTSPPSNASLGPTPSRDLKGTMPGQTEPDRTVLLGNHRDAWVCGANDPVSGTAVLLEMARGFGVMLRRGWRPRRTVTFASWDAEEYGLFGSTEWVEQHAAVLQHRAVAYINVDGLSGPTFKVPVCVCVCARARRGRERVCARTFFAALLQFVAVARARVTCCARLLHNRVCVTTLILVMWLHGGRRRL